MKCRLGQLSLAVMIIALANKQAVAEDFLYAINRKPFGEVPVLCDQEVANVIGAVQ